MAPALDRRLAAGEDPFGDAALRCRATALQSRRARRAVVIGLERVLREHRHPGWCAAVPADSRALEIARPALEQLALAIHSWDAIEPQGMALTHVLLSDPCSALYHPAYADELYERARDALFALGRHRAVFAAHNEARRIEWALAGTPGAS